MSFKKFVVLTPQTDDNTTNQTIQLLQQNLQRSLDPITGRSNLDKYVLPSVSLILGQPNLVAHKLGRAIIGYSIVSRSTNANVWDNINDPQATLLASYVTLYCDVDVTITIEVF